MLHTYAVIDGRTGARLGTLQAIDTADADFIAQGTYLDIPTLALEVYEID